jgi:hypothetical protein
MSGRFLFQIYPKIGKLGARSALQCRIASFILPRRGD